MRKPLLTRLKALLTAVCAPLYTRPSNAATAEFSLEPDTDPIGDHQDTWLFESEEALEAARLDLSKDMNAIADSLSDLRETLAFIHGEMPMPMEAATAAPDTVLYHDDALFEGEAAAPTAIAQEEISGGEGVFLFDDAPSFEDEQAAHQQAA